MDPPKVVARKGAKQVSQIASAERGENTTMLAFINAAGQVIPPVYVFPRVHVNCRMYNLGPPGSLGLSNKSGWMTDDNCLLSIKHFQSETKSTKEDPHLLLMDNHGSHISVEIVHFCRENRIVVLTFPPHCSHKLQPLDISVYGPFKNGLRNSFNEWLIAHPGGRISIHEVAELSRQPFLDKFCPSNIVAGFQRPGIFPFNRHAFGESDFLPALVTDVPLAATTNSTTEAADHGEVIQDSEPEGPAPGTSGTAPITPESVRPHPRIDPTKRNPSNGRKRGKTRILTDTPEKEQLEKEKHNREAKKAKKKTPQKKITKTKKMVGRRQTKVGNKRKPSAFIRLSVSETSSSEPELPDDICDDESDMSLDLGEDDVVASDRPVSPIQIGKFVLVKFELGKSKSSCVYYVGLVESIDNDVADVKFLRKIGPKFVFPEIEDKATVDKKDIVLVLPDPSSSGGTARSIAGHVFSRDFSAFNIK